MKFHEVHRKDILASIEALGFPDDKFSFKKKKGRIFVEHNSTKVWFSYYFKDQSYIDMITKERVESGSWEIKNSAKEFIEVDNWKKVIKQLKSWLKQFN